MGISLLTLSALVLALYFGWALADPKTFKEVEDIVAHRGSTTFQRVRALRLRNGLGLVIALALLTFSLYQDVTGESNAVRATKTKSVHPIAPELAEDPAISERIDGLTLQKQIEHQQRGAAWAKP